MESFRGTLNRVELIGRLGQDPESRQAGSTQVVRLRIATHYPQRDNEQGTDWWTVEAWDKLGERCVEYLQRGSKVRIVGRLSNQKWTDGETGEERQRTVIRASDVLFLDGRGDQGGQAEVEDQPQTQEA